MESSLNPTKTGNPQHPYQYAEPTLQVGRFGVISLWGRAEDVSIYIRSIIILDTPELCQPQEFATLLPLFDSSDTKPCPSTPHNPTALLKLGSRLADSQLPRPAPASGKGSWSMPSVPPAYGSP